MTTSGVLTLVSQGTADGSPTPDNNNEQGVPCTFTLDDSAITWQSEAGAASGSRDGRFLLLDALEITRTAPDTFVLTYDGEQHTVRAQSESECTMWFNAISRGIHEARGDEESNEEEREGEEVEGGTNNDILFDEPPSSSAAANLGYKEEEEEEDDEENNTNSFCDGLTFVSYVQPQKVHREIHTPEDLTELLKTVPENVSGINAGAIVVDYDGEKWSKSPDSAHVFLSRYEDEIAEAKRELRATDMQTERRKLQAKAETLEKSLRSPACVQAVFNLPGCPVIYKDGEWGFYKAPPEGSIQPPQQNTFAATAGFLKKGWSSFSRMFASAGNELTQNFADFVDSIPLSMKDMLEEAPVPADCRPAKRLTDDLGAFIRSLPPPPVTKENVFILAGKLGAVLRLGMKPGKDLWDWVASYGGNRQFSTSEVAFLPFKRCVDTLISASAAFSDKSELFVKFVSCALHKNSLPVWLGLMLNDKQTLSKYFLESASAVQNPGDSKYLLQTLKQLNDRT